ncbi:aminoglycoside phosphotransferase family protein [Streptomyces sp. NBC_01261]|uniref:aminoglycoside phosphotransferase family protein n=1 Tax=Streptomyces sp. NBC_01261 TaxID=2903802 RepID=UPI002E32DCCE|nr:aminoglycoside phosphotransferase family protein [Streptomyces sp. NBC_01261]
MHDDDGDDDTATVVDRGQYENAKTPWDQATWRNEALAWATRELAARGLRESGTARRNVRLRPWSVLVRIPVEGGATTSTSVWLKANPPASAFEAPLTAALARRVPEYVLEPLAVDADRGWSLLPDGGELFRQVLDRTPTDARAWEEPLRQYATMQRTLVPYTKDLEQLGVPSARTTTLPQVFDETVEFIGSVLDKTPAPLRHPAPDTDPTTLRTLRPRLLNWAAELADLGIPDSLDHSDLHDGQLFNPEPGRFTFFDWGDAAVSHPFCSFLVPAGRVTERYGPDALPRLRDAYLEPWTGTGPTGKDLRRALTLAGRLGVIGRAVSWGRHFPGASDETRAAGATQSAKWLRQLASEEPPF